MSISSSSRRKPDNHIKADDISVRCVRADVRGRPSLGFVVNKDKKVLYKPRHISGETECQHAAVSGHSGVLAFPAPRLHLL